MGEGGVREVFGGPPQAAAKAKKPVPVPGHESNIQQGKKLWRPFRLLNPDLSIESVPKQGLRNVPRPINLTEEEHRADLRRADAQKQINKLQEKFSREKDENKRAGLLKKIAMLEAKL